LQVYHNDQEVCGCLLNGIQIYVKFFKSLMPDEFLNEARLTLVKMVEVFL